MTTYYTEDHEWLRVEGDTGVIGVTAHAAEALGEVVFVEIKDPGEAVEKNGELGVVESVKAASEIYAPVACEVIEVNEALGDTPGFLNESPEADAWLCKVKITDASELAGLMDADAYKALIA